MFKKEEKSSPRVFTYDLKQLRLAIAENLKLQLPPRVWHWLEEQALATTKNENFQPFTSAFAMMPRKTGKQKLVISDAQSLALNNLRTGLVVTHWTVDRLARVWLIMHLDATQQNRYTSIIQDLFLAAEMSEQVALYSALPIFAYPETWAARCAEGIRSNIGEVQASIMCYNPYPCENLDEPAWNQLVLKAIFTEKPLHQITGLDARANQTLAIALAEYAHERWAARRAVHPMLWRCVGKFINERIFPDIQRIASSEQTQDRKAAALACAQSTFKPATELLANDARLQSILKTGLTWHNFATELHEHF